SVTRIRRSATRGSDVYRSRPTMTLNGIMRLAGTQRVRLANQHARGRARATLRIGDAGWVIARSQTGKNGAAGYPSVGNAIDYDRVRRGAATDCHCHTAIITTVATCRSGRL